MTRRSAFTLIELLVVLAILFLLMAMLLPVIQRVRDASSRIACQNNLKQMGIGLHVYHENYGRFPPAIQNLPLPDSHSWASHLLPFLEQDGIAVQYYWNRPWFDPINQGAVQKQVPLFLCPTASSGRVFTDAGQSYGACDYSPIANVDLNLVATGLLDPWRGNTSGVMDFGRGYRIADIRDGTSQTLLLAEDAGRPEHWQRRKLVGTTGLAGWACANRLSPINLDGFSQDGTIMYGPGAINCTNVHEVYSFHPSGANVLFSDGHVAFLHETISIRTLAALVTRSGEEVITEIEN